MSEDNLTNTPEDQISSKLINLEKQILSSWLYKDKITFLLSLGEKVSISGQKPFIGWGSISEHLIASVLSKLGIFKRAKEEQELKIFDPFMGSGTILLEALFGCIDYPKDPKLVRIFRHNTSFCHD